MKNISLNVQAADAQQVVQGHNDWERNKDLTVTAFATQLARGPGT